MATISPMRNTEKITYREQGKRERPRKGWTWQSMVMAFLLLVLVYFLVPLFWVIVSATKTSGGLFTSFGLWFTSDFNLWQNLQDLFTYDGGIFLTWFWNSIYYSTCSALGASLLATFGGYALAKYHFAGRNLFFVLILGGIMLPNTALAVPLYLLMSRVGLVNTPWAVILPSLVTPFGLYLMWVYAEQAIPDDLLDACRIDGRSEWGIFWHVAFVLMRPGFATVLLLTFVGTWNNFFLPQLVMTNPNSYPLTVGLANWDALAQKFSGSQILFPLVITGSLLSIIPLIVGFLLLQRYWQRGLSFGSLKG